MQKYHFLLLKTFKNTESAQLQHVMPTDASKVSDGPLPHAHAAAVDAGLHQVVSWNLSTELWWACSCAKGSR